MGLLDDAIREHLELKRLKGTNPGDVAREEREVLGEGRAAEQTAASRYEDGYGQVHGEPARPSQERDGEPAAHDGPPARVTVGQETIELDTESMQASNSRSATNETDSDGEKAAAVQPRQVPDAEESLEWEMPAEQESDELDDDIERRPEHESVDDVLEETPDFLRETPEQERLWFEQRPPRDFDFNE